MFFIFETNSQKLLLTAEQVAILTETLASAELIHEKYMGSNKPNLVTIIPPNIREAFRLNVLDQASYDAIVLVTKLQAAADAEKNR